MIAVETRADHPHLPHHPLHRHGGPGAGTERTDTMSATMNLDDGLSPDMTAAGSAVVRGVQFVCPLCGADRDGSYVEDPSGTAWA